MAYIVPLKKMVERVELARQESDTALFFSLLLLGEMLVKTVAAVMVSLVRDDRERHRYSLLHTAVRADSLGAWSTILDDVLVGPSAQHISPNAFAVQSELIQKCGEGTWQWEANYLLNECVKTTDPDWEGLPPKVDGRRWFATFVKLRNATRGHGAPTPGLCSSLCGSLEKSIHLVMDRCPIFHTSWVYLHQGMSGRYRVSKISQDTSPFDSLKDTISPGPSLPDGVYVHFGDYFKVELIFSNPDLTDFCYPNGNFNGSHFELISYITGSTPDADSGPYLLPASELAPSETKGLGAFEVYGNTFTNIPPCPDGYVSRNALEAELLDRLCDDRHPIITLVGRGGIGKTSLALHVLHQVLQTNRFGLIVWFSSRDIDLLPQGPKPVKPDVLDELDAANQFVQLMRPTEAKEKGFKPIKYMAECLTASPIQDPILFVFDNFETVRVPGDLYNWLDTFIRPRNKVLITTRYRDFRGDFHVEVPGMTEDECVVLIKVTAEQLGVSGLLTKDYKSLLYRESDGHPYVIKVLLGEVAKNNTLVKIERVVATKEEILNALFERTYSHLSPTARRVFLTLCNWRSIIPQVAVEAVLLRPSNDLMDVSEAIEELRKSSLVEVVTSKVDKTAFLSVPLAAFIFGERKLAISPLRSAIYGDTELIQAFGATLRSEIKSGLKPKIERLFKQIAERIARKKASLDEMAQTLEFVARRYPNAWLFLSSLYEEQGGEKALVLAKEAVSRFLESRPPKEEAIDAWQRFAALCQKTEDWLGESQALVEMCELPAASIRSISNAVNRVNTLFKQHYPSFQVDEKQTLVNRLIAVLVPRIKECDATDCSRVAWLFLHLKDEVSAKRYIREGLDRDPDNEHCQNLAIRLGLFVY